MHCSADCMGRISCHRLRFDSQVPGVFIFVLSFSSEEMCFRSGVGVVLFACHSVAALCDNI